MDFTMASRSTLETVSESEAEAGSESGAEGEDLQPMIKRESISWVIRTGRSEADQISARLERLEQHLLGTRHERLEQEFLGGINDREELKSLVREEVNKELRSVVRDEVHKAVLELECNSARCSEMEARLETYTLDKVHGLRCEFQDFIGTALKQIHGWCSEKISNERDELHQVISKAVENGQTAMMKELDRRGTPHVHDLNANLNEVIAKMDSLLVDLVDKSPESPESTCPDTSAPSPLLTSRTVDSAASACSEAISESSYLSAVKAPRGSHREHPEQSLLQPLLEKMQNEGRILKASTTAPATPMVQRRTSWGCATEYRQPSLQAPVLLGAVPVTVGKRVQVLYAPCA